MGVKLKFRPSSSKGKKGSVHFQFIYRNEIRHVPSGYNVYPDEWHDSFACIVIPENTDSERKEYLREAFKDLSEKLATFKKVFAALKWLKRIIPSIRSLNYASNRRQTFTSLLLLTSWSVRPNLPARQERSRHTRPL